MELRLAISNSVLERQTGAAFVDDLAAIGVHAALVERPASVHQRALLGMRDFDLATVGWFGDVGHAGEFLALFEPGDLDITGFDDTTFQSLTAEAAVTADPTVRTALFEAADRRLMAMLPAIPLMHFETFKLVSPELSGWEDNVIDIHLSRWLSPAVAEE